MSDKEPMPENFKRLIRRKAKVFCRKPDEQPDVVFTHKDYSLIGLLAYHQAADDMYCLMRARMEYQMAMHRALDPRRDKIYYECQELFIRYIAKWKLGQTNSGLGAALESKFYMLMARHVRELSALNDELTECLDFIKQVANDVGNPILQIQAMCILSNKG